MCEVEPAFDNLENDPAVVACKRIEFRRYEEYFPEEELGACLYKSNLKHLPPDFYFLKSHFPDCFFKRGRKNFSIKLKTRIAWSLEWLKYRNDRLNVFVPDINSIPIVDAFNNLTNVQLRLWARNQVYKLRERDSLRNLAESSDQEQLPSLLLALSDISSLPSKFHFKTEMFPKRFLLPPAQLSENSVTEITSWTNHWLRRMARDKYEIDGKKGKYIPLEKMFINLAFNQLPKGQLRYWLRNLLEQWNWNSVPISEGPEVPKEK